MSRGEHHAYQRVLREDAAGMPTPSDVALETARGDRRCHCRALDRCLLSDRAAFRQLQDRRRGTRNKIF